MSTMVATERVTISLECPCDYPSCAELAFRIHKQLNVPKYTEGMSIMPCPQSLEEWQADHRTARKRAWRAERLGYVFAEVDLARFNEDVYAINTSLDTRQGRPMSEGYRRPAKRGSLPRYECGRHAIRTYGVLEGERLRSYMTLYRVGQLAMVSMILGHGDSLRDDVMYLLVAGAIERHGGEDCHWFYNRWDSGEDGLRFFKTRVGFRETDIAWSLT